MCDVQLESGFLFLKGSSAGLSTPFVLADIALLLVFSNCDLFASALRTSFLSTHLFYISSAGGLMSGTAIVDTSFQVCVRASRKTDLSSSKD